MTIDDLQAADDTATLFVATLKTILAEVDTWSPEQVIALEAARPELTACAAALKEFIDAATSNGS